MAMHTFAHGNATSVEEAVDALNETTRPLAGGTDLIAMMKEKLIAPERLVNLKTIPGLDHVTKRSDGWHLGAMLTLSALASAPDVKADAALACLVQATVKSASPQLRNMATLGGNLVQRPRCWYFRNPEVPCWRKGGRRCFAYQGLNTYHTIFGPGPCYAVHPSDPAVALLALDASVLVVSPRDRRTLSLGEFYVSPTPDRARASGYHPVTVLDPDEMIVEVIIPMQSEGTQSAYAKAMERSTWDFALVSAAVVLVASDDVVDDVRIALGGVATSPWRAEAAEAALKGQHLTPQTIADAAEAAVEDARPLEHNGYKVDLVKAVLQEALREVS
ncbi:MAG: FAD binding domain-containing protein [Anaerolineae bacterium]